MFRFVGTFLLAIIFMIIRNLVKYDRVDPHRNIIFRDHWLRREIHHLLFQKKSTILVAEGHKESAILDAEAEKQAAILRAEAAS